MFDRRILRPARCEWTHQQESVGIHRNRLISREDLDQTRQTSKHKEHAKRAPIRRQSSDLGLDHYQRLSHHVQHTTHNQTQQTNRQASSQANRNKHTSKRARNKRKQPDARGPLDLQQASSSPKAQACRSAPTSPQGASRLKHPFPANNETTHRHESEQAGKQAMCRPGRVS